MKPDLKIGIIVGVLVVVVLMIFFVSRTPPPRPSEGQGPYALNQSDQIDLSQSEFEDNDLVPALSPMKPPIESVAPTPEIEPVVPAPDVHVIIQSDQSDAGDLQPAVSEAPAPAFNDPPPVPKPIPVVNEKKSPRYYVVQEGDSLSEISLEYFSSANYWKEIQKANRHLIKDANQLKLGWKLRIPYPSELADKNR
jgi:nucleoid-associated protein YgaU